MNTTAAPTPPRSDNNLINGKGNYDCSLVPAGTDCVPNAGLSVFKFQSGKTHRLRLINAGAEGIQRFTIDGYEMTVIANDFVPIKPYPTNMVTLGVGQRTDILVKANGKPTDAVWMRSNISENCSLPSQPYALAAIYYENANKTLEPTTTATTYSDTHCGNVSIARAPENNGMLSPYSRTTWIRPFHISRIHPWGTLQQLKKFRSLSSKTAPATGNGLRMTNTSEPTTSMFTLQYR